MDNESLYKRLQKEIDAMLAHHQQAAIGLLSSGAIEELRFQGGFINACQEIKAKAEQMLQNAGLELR